MPKDSVSVLLEHTRTGRETTVAGMGAARAGVASDRANTRDYLSACQRPPAVRSTWNWFSRYQNECM